MKVYRSALVWRGRTQICRVIYVTEEEEDGLRILLHSVLFPSDWTQWRCFLRTWLVSSIGNLINVMWRKFQWLRQTPFFWNKSLTTSKRSEPILCYVICQYRSVEQLWLQVCWRLIPIFELKNYQSDSVWFFVGAGLYCEFERIMSRQHAVFPHYLFHSCHSAIQILGYIHGTMTIYQLLLCWNDRLCVNQWLAIQKHAMQTRHENRKMVYCFWFITAIYRQDNHKFGYWGGGRCVNFV